MAATLQFQLEATKANPPLPPCTPAGNNRRQLSSVQQTPNTKQTTAVSRSSSGKENAAAAAADLELKLSQKDEEIRNLHAKLKEAQEQKVKVRRLPTSKYTLAAFSRPVV